MRNALATLHRECSGRRVLMVAHGELMLAFRLVLERWSDEAFAEHDATDADPITNCTLLHYSRTDPDSGELHSTLAFLRTACPVEVDGTWEVRTTEWRPITSDTLSNQELRSSFAD